MTTQSPEGYEIQHAGALPVSAESTESTPDIKRTSVLNLTILTTVCAAVVLVPLACTMAPLKYTASASIRFLSIRPSILESSFTTSSGSYEKFVNTQAALITGDLILTRISTNPEVSRLPSIANANDRMNFLRSSMQTRQQPGTELVVVTCTMDSREEARMILENVVDEYLAFALSHEASAGSERLRILVSERDKQQAEVELLMREMLRLQATVGPIDENGTPSSISAFGTFWHETLEARGEVTRLETALKFAEGRAAKITEWENLYAAEPDLDVADAKIQQYVDTDPDVIFLARELAKIHARSELDAAHSTDQYRNTGEPSASTASLETRLSRSKHVACLAALKTEQEGLAKEIEGIKVDAAQARERVETFQGMLDAAARELESHAGEAARLQDIRNRVEERRRLVTQLNRQISDIGIESQAPTRVSLVAPVTVPMAPDYSPRIALVLIAFGASLLLGLFVGAFVAVRRILAKA